MDNLKILFSYYPDPFFLVKLGKLIVFLKKDNTFFLFVINNFVFILILINCSAFLYYVEIRSILF